MENIKKMFETMYRIRQFEKNVSSLYADSKIPGFVHLYIGEEAVAAGVCACLGTKDTITSTHRGHGHLIAKGGHVKYMMAELYGKKTGYCKGKGGSMHIADIELGILGANGIVGGGLPIATGSAYAHKLQKNGNVAVAFFGEGASNEGTFHESMNAASVWDLPLIFVCENNNYGVSTRINRVSNLPNISSRAASYGMRTVVVDGNNMVQVNEASQKAVEAARAGFGPSLIECNTFRHHGHFEGENVTYLLDNEKESWLKNDPIIVGEKVLIGMGATQQDISKIKVKVDEEIKQAIKFAEESPYPDPQDAETDLYYAGGE